MSETLRRNRPRAVLVIEDDAALRELLVEQLDFLGYRASGAGSLAEADTAMVAETPDLILLDQYLPDAKGLSHLGALCAICPVIVLTGHGSVDQAVSAVQAGAADYLTKPILPRVLEMSINRVLETAALKSEIGYLRRHAVPSDDVLLVGQSPAMRAVRRRAEMVAQADAPVMIQSESGAGKKTLARHIHRLGPRRDGRFVALDCLRSDQNALVRELFGVADAGQGGGGAMFGAGHIGTPGLLDMADGGTLYLNEVTKLPPNVQSRLVQLSETGTFRRQGGTREMAADIRLIAATSQPADGLVKEGAFLPELYFMLGALTIEIPPLRDRLDDIPDLARHFLSVRKFAADVKKEFARETLEMMQDWSWPGNLRELRNVVERSIILSGEAPVIRPDHTELGRQTRMAASGGKGLDIADEPDLETLRERYLDVLLRRHDGNRQVIAQVLGISERSLYRILKQKSVES